MVCFIYWWMTQSIASGTAHAASHEIEISFLKNSSKGQTVTQAGNSAYQHVRNMHTLTTGTQLTLGSVFITGTVHAS